MDRTLGDEVPNPLTKIVAVCDRCGRGFVAVLDEERARRGELVDGFGRRDGKYFNGAKCGGRIRMLDVSE